MSNNLPSNQRCNWCWYSIRHNSLHAPISPKFPNRVQRMFMRVFGLEALVLYD